MIELLVILLLVLCNGLLAGAEIAVVSARRGRLTELAESGSRGAAAVLQLKRDPERFLATVQVGITVISAFAGAFGGATFARDVAEVLATWPLVAGFAKELAFVAVVGLITYLSVVLGELVPKSLALRHATTYAVLLARPVLVLQTLVRPVIWLLAASSNAVLRPFHDKTSFIEARVSREDIESMVAEASNAGAVGEATGRLLERALEFEELRVGDVMVPRNSMVTVSRDAGHEELRRAFLEHGHRRVPVEGDGVDDIVGYVLRDDVLAAVWNGKAPSAAELLRPPAFIPEQTSAHKALIRLQASKLHLAIVVDEMGGVAGLVTLEDLLEELVGEIFDERDVPPQLLRRESDGSWLASGLLEIRQANRELDLELDEPGAVRTLGGLCVFLAGGRLPRSGERFHASDGTAVEVVDATQRRVKTVRLWPRGDGAADGSPPAEA